MTMTTVRVEKVTKRYGNVVAINNVNLTFEKGKLTTILGLSGSGKTTLLRIIAGLIRNDSGNIYFDEKEVTEIPPHQRNIGFVFQNIALFLI